METHFFISSIFALAIFVVLVVNYIRHHKDERSKKVILYFLLIGMLYLVDSIFSFIWAFGILDYVSGDYLFIHSIIILLQSFFIFNIIYHITCNKKLFYFLAAYVILFFLVLFLGISFMSFFILASYLFMLLLFIGISFSNRGYRKSAYSGAVYSVLALVMHIFYFLELGRLSVYSIFAKILFLGFIIYFYRNLEENLPDLAVPSFGKQKHYIFLFLSHFVFMLVLITFVFVGTIVIHEFGHLAVSNFYDCEYGKIVYDGTYPHTEVICPDIGSAINFVYGAGSIFPFIVSLILLIVGGKFLREMALLILGFNFVISFKDFADMGLHDNIIMFFVILGIFLAVGGIILLARSKTEEYIYSIGRN